MAAPNDFTINILYLVGFLDLLGVSMIIPLLSLHAKELGASPATIGILGSLYGFLQLFSSPIVGNWSDRAGRRLVLLYTLLLAAAGYFMLASATTVMLLFLARIPTGIFKHSQEVAVSYISTAVPKCRHHTVLGRFQAMSSVGFTLGPVLGGHLAEIEGGFHLVALATTAIFVLNAGVFKHSQNLLKVSLSKQIPKEKQSAAFGRFNAISTMGFVVGPVLGGHLSDLLDGQVKVFYMSAALFVINAGIVWWFLPSDVPTQSEDTAVDTSEPGFGIQLTLFIQNLKAIDWPMLWDIFLVRFLLGFGVIVFRSNFSLMLNEQYSLTSKDIGYIISFNSIISTVSGLFVGHIARFYSNDQQLLLHMTFVQVASFALSVFAPSTMVLIAVLAPLSLANAVMRVCVTNLTILRCRSEETGAVLGCGASVLSFARMMSPMVGGFALQAHTSGPSICAVISALAGAAVLSIVGNVNTKHQKTS